MDWLGWKTTIRLLREYPELFAAAVQFALFWGAAVWGVRSLIGKERVATLEKLNENLERRLSEVREDLGNAQSEQQRIAAELDVVKKTSALQAYELQSELQQLKDAAQKEQQKPQQTVQIYVNLDRLVTTVTNSTATLEGHIRTVAQANTNLGTALSEIASKLEGKSDLRADATVIKSS